NPWFVTALWWKNTSSPSLAEMNPNPFSCTNFLILPNGIEATPSHTSRFSGRLVCAEPAPPPLPLPHRRFDPQVVSGGIYGSPAALDAGTPTCCLGVRGLRVNAGPGPQQF